MCRVSRERGRGQLVRRARFWRTLVWVATPLVTSSFTQACIHRTPTYVLTRTQTGFTPHSPNIDIKAIPSTTTHSANAAAIGPDRAATGARSHYHTHHSSHDGRK